MLNSESVQAFDRPLFTGHGGARAGAGRPAGTGAAPYVKSEDQKNLDTQKARHEKVKADLAELDFRQKVGELVSRDGVRRAAAHALATLAQGMRSIPDSLERRMNISPEVAEAIGIEIDAVLDGLASEFEMLSGPEPAVLVEPDA